MTMNPEGPNFARQGINAALNSASEESFTLFSAAKKLFQKIVIKRVPGESGIVISSPETSTGKWFRFKQTPSEKALSAIKYKAEDLIKGRSPMALSLFSDFLKSATRVGFDVAVSMEGNEQVHTLTACEGREGKYTDHT